LRLDAHRRANAFPALPAVAIRGGSPLLQQTIAYNSASLARATTVVARRTSGNENDRRREPRQEEP
jgi:hypothetical protein